MNQARLPARAANLAQDFLHKGREDSELGDTATVAGGRRFSGLYFPTIHFDPRFRNRP